MPNPANHNGDQQPRRTLRIASLLPSSTDTCVALNLSAKIVGITHECDLKSILVQREEDRGEGQEEDVLILTSSGLPSDASQRQIDDLVKESWSAALSDFVGEDGTAAASAHAKKVESLYPLNSSTFAQARPNVVLTQDLCRVCAPSSSEVRTLCSGDMEVVSLTPKSLEDVAETFVQIGDACCVAERGQSLKHQFLSDLDLLRTTVDEARSFVEEKRPKVLVLEWLDPPYDAGHWIPSMIDRAGCISASIGCDDDMNKSKQITWEEIYQTDPDVLLVSCCGFDLERNKSDALMARERLGKLRAARDGRIYATNGDVYFARPGPKLVGGATIIAQCAYSGVEDEVVENVGKLTFCVGDGLGWEQVDVLGSTPPFPNREDRKVGTAKHSLPPDATVPDMEDLNEDFTALHTAACHANQMTYTDPKTGYQVFTELAHRKRGKCCGSGCRHCPFNHENVKDKAKRIQQPAFLCEEEDAELFSIRNGTKVKVLFFSSGKDSFLTIRALVRQHAAADPFGLVLLTTFDATSRIIAHQDTHIDVAIRQARHLGIALVGVPMQRGSKEPYLERIRRGIDLINSRIENKVSALVFGDLHLDHIRNWRDNILGKLDYDLEYPLWKVPYTELIDDLEESGVKCVVSASERCEVAPGDEFSRAFMSKVGAEGMDGFGECGEFHTVAEVWRVGRERALGMVAA